MSEPDDRPPDEPPADERPLPEVPQAETVADAVAHEVLPDVRPAPGELARPIDVTPHAARFQFIYGVLIAIAVTAVAATAYLVGHDRGSAQPVGPFWSAWAPTKGGGNPLRQISNHVGPEYRLPGGQQLVAVTGGPMEVAGFPLTIALREDPTNNNNITLISGSDGVLYRLCGLGPKCAIDHGKPSTERHLLLRREALELALYTFRYIRGVNDVVVLMPPRLGEDPSQALFFRLKDVVPELDRPLDRSLAARTPSIRGVAASPDAPLVDRITTASLFKFSLTQANQDNQAFLVLDRFDAPSR
jgi:hypothetical protein